MERLKYFSLCLGIVSLMLLMPQPVSAQRGGHMGGGSHFGGARGGFSGRAFGFSGGGSRSTFSGRSIGGFRGFGGTRGGFGSFGGRRGFGGRFSGGNRFFFGGFYGYPYFNFYSGLGYGYWPSYYWPYYGYPWYPAYDYYYNYYPDYYYYGGTVPYTQLYQGQQQSAPGSATTARYWLIALKNNTVIVATDYWLEGSVLHYHTLQGQESSVDYSQVDLDLTRQLNDERGLEFKTPQTRTSYQPRRYDEYGRLYRSGNSQVILAAGPASGAIDPNPKAKLAATSFAK